jgi:hypothetical protein
VSSLDLFWDDLSTFSIFSRWSTRAHVSILIAYLESSQKIESDEYDIIDMQQHSISSSVYF